MTITKFHWAVITVLWSPTIIVGMEQQEVREEKVCSLSLLNSTGHQLAFRLCENDRQSEDEAPCTLTLIPGQRIDLPLRDYSLIQVSPYGRYREWMSAPAITFGMIAGTNLASHLKESVEQSNPTSLLLEVQAGGQVLGNGLLAALMSPFISYKYNFKILQEPAPKFTGSLIELFPQLCQAIKKGQPVYPRYVLSVSPQAPLKELRRVFTIMNWFWQQSMDSSMDRTVMRAGRELIAAAYESLAEDEDLGLQVDMAHFQRKLRQLLPLAATEVLFAEDNPLQKIDERCQTLLQRAAELDRKDVVSIVIARGVPLNSVDDKHNTALYYATVLGHKDIVDILVIHGAQLQYRVVDERPVTPFLTAAQAGCKDEVIELIAGDVDLNSSGEYGSTALHRAAFFGHTEIVDLLLKQGANVQCTTDNGCTPLHSAAFAGHKEICVLLVEAKAFVNAQTELEIFPLTMAANNGHKAVVKYLLRCGADLKAAAKQLSREGDSSLSSACAELLIETLH